MRSTFRFALLVLPLLAACTRPQPAEGGSTRATTPPPPAAAVDPRVRDGLVSALSGFEHIASKEELDRLGSPPALVAALSSIYDDASAEMFVRVNALASLRFYPLPQSRAVLERALMSPDTPDPARRSAVKAYGAGFGAKAVPILDRLLDHPELHTRNAAAGTLAAIHDPRAQDALRRRLPQEKEPLVRKTIQSGLGR
jgi:HEAT repeat protein